MDQEKQDSTQTLWTKSFVFIMLVSLITAMGFNMVYVIISKYAVDISASLTIAGVVSGIFSIAALLTRPFAGMTADKVNKKNLLIMANAVIGVAVLGYGLSSNIPILFTFRILHGIAFGVSSTVNIALATTFIPKARLAEGLGYYGLGQVVAQVVSPNLGVYIESAYGFQVLFLLVAGLSFLASAMLFKLHYPEALVPEKKTKKKLKLDAFIALEVAGYAAIGGMFSFSNGIISSFLVLVGEERNIANVGLFFSVGAIVLFIMRLFIGRIVDKQGLSLVVSVALVVSAIGMALIGVAQALVFLLIAAVFKSVGQGAGQISLQTACIKRVDATRVGVATSTFYIGADIGQGVGPMIGGAISSQFNYTVLFFVCSILMLIALVMFNLFQRKAVEVTM